MQLELGHRFDFRRPPRKRADLGLDRGRRLDDRASGDIARVLTAGSRHSVRDGRAVLHSLPIGYVLDQARGIRDPRGMLAREFGIDMHVVTADASVARNLMLAIERCHLAVEAMVDHVRMPPASPPSPTTKPNSVPPWSTWAPARPRSRSFAAVTSCMPTGSRSAADT